MKKISRNSHWIIVIGFLLFASLLFFVRGEKSVIAVHDNLDLFTPQYQMMKDTGTFFSRDGMVPFLDESSRNELPSEINLYTMLYFLFPSYYAYVIGYLLKVLLAIFGGYFLAKDILKDRFDEYKKLVVLAGLGYGILNLFPNFGISFSSIPLLILIIRKINNKSGLLWYLALLLYPTVSYFSYFGFFILGYLCIYFIYRWIKTRHFPWRILISIILLSLSYIGCEYRLFSTMLFSNYETIRSSMVIASLSFGEIVNEIISSFMYGDMHSEASQAIFIMPLCLVFLVYETIIYIRKKEVRKIFKDPFFGVMLFIFLNSVIYGIYNSEAVRGVFEFILPPLSGFQFSRTIFFNPFLWYVALFIVAKRIYDMLPKAKFISGVIILVAILVTLLSNTRYNDIYHTSYDIAKETLSSKRSNDLSYEEFFSEKLFDKVKEEIGYDGEWAAAYGFYPAVLEYNEIRTIDGYLGYYSQAYKDDFRKIIAPALDKQPGSAAYYDNWGARCYLFSGQYSSIVNAYRDYEYTNDELCINTDAFKNVGGRYIFSRVKLDNAKDMGFDEIGVFEDESSTYTVYVYRTSSVYGTKEHSNIPYDEREIPSYDLDRFYAALDELEGYADEASKVKEETSLSDEEVLAKFGYEDEVLALYDECNAIFDVLSSANSMYTIETYTDVNNQDAIDESDLVYEDILDAGDDYSVVMRKICNSPYAVTMKQRLRQYVINAYKQYEEMTDEEKDRDLKLKSLVDEYNQASGEDYYIEYNGEEWNESKFVEEANNGTLSDDDIVNLYMALGKERAGVLGEIYKEIVLLESEKADEADFDSYPEYAYAVELSKDFTLDDVKSLCEEVREKCVPYVKKINQIAYEYEGASEEYLYDDVETYKQLEPYFSKISPELAESVNYLINNKLFDLEYSEKKMDTGATLVLKDAGDAFIFDSPTGVRADIYTYVHEFGHFNYDYHIAQDDGEYYSNLDFMEYHSQGMELLFLKYYSEIFGEDLGNALSIGEINHIINAILQGCMVTEFEIYAFEHPDATVDELSEEYCNIGRAYGMNYLSGVKKIYDWVDIPHIFQVPFYYISYSTSALAALETYASSLEDYDKAVEKYLEMSALQSNWGFKNVLHFVGLNDIFEEGNARGIFKTTYNHLAKMSKDE